MKKQTGLMKWLLIFLGFLFVLLAIIGIFLPVLPTTPFLLLAASCFIRSSDKFYNLLMNNRFFGKYLKSYYQNRAVPKRIKTIATVVLWISILTTITYMIDILWLKIVLGLIAVFITLHISKLKTIEETR